METIEFEHDRVIASKNDKVKCWYLIQQGAVLMRTELSEIQLEPNYIIGILEKDIYMCDYVAIEDTNLVVLNCLNPDDILKTLAGQERIRNIFLRAAIIQRHQLLVLYSDLSAKTRQFVTMVGSMYDEYKTLCAKYKVETMPFPLMDLFKPLVIQHKAERWEINSSVAIVKNYMADYIQLMRKDDNMTLGIIMETAAQMRRFTSGILEMENYITYNKEILLNDSEIDLFKLFFDLSIKLYDKKYPIDPALENARKIAELCEKLKIYSPRLIKRRLTQFEEYDYAGVKAAALADDDNANVRRKEMDVIGEHGISHILEYAGYSDAEVDELSALIEGFFNDHDIMSTDKATYTLRKKITSLFYEIYLKVFLRAVENENTLTPLIEMFLNFGFMDSSLVGEERTRELYDLCSHLDICHSRNIYTIYEWLKQIYKGKKETSKNEYDCNYPTYLNNLVKEKRITKEEMNAQLNDRVKRVEFEVQNMFTTTNKLTFGRITTFCPILTNHDLINPVDKMLVTAEKIENALNEIRKTDYSIFYREVAFSDNAAGIANERLMKEVLPDIILLPNAGTRSMMWQETTTVKSDTPARFMFPIFTLTDLMDLMLLNMGQYRWEICRKIEGVRWNDLREKSLTAEYCNYLQFYRKNNNLSPESKEKIKSALQTAKNNYREVFARDYINWIKFEARGAYRLNKVARDVLARYCPFSKQIRTELAVNPLYQTSIARFENELAKKKQHYAGVLNKCEKAGSENVSAIRETLMFYDM